MKRIFLILIALVAFGATVNAQSTYSKVDNKTFKSEKVIKAKASTYTPTGNYYIAKDGVKYEIYLHTVTKGDNKGRTFCYIKRVSKKSGKPYWQKIDVEPKEVA